MSAGAGPAPPSRVSGPGWVNIGPSDQGGRASAIAVHPADPNVAWVGAADGGVWRWDYDSSTSSSTWTPLFDDQPTLSIGAIAVDPTDPDRLYVGTGEQNFAIDNYRGVGLIRSTDGGATWLAPVLQNATRIGHIEVRPDTPQVVFAATSVGLQRSTDFGDTWEQVLTTDILGTATDVVIDPSDPDQIYAGMRSGSGPSGIWKSTTGGAPGSFVQLTGSGACTLSTIGNGSRVALAISPSNPSVLYAAINHGGFGEIWKTTDAGATWCDVSPLINFCGSQCGYDIVLGVDPTDPDNVLAGGIQVYRSTDGGATWLPVLGIHVDHHAIEFLGNTGFALDGNDGGVYRLDLSGPATVVVNLEAGFVTVQYYGMGYDPTDRTYVYGGTQDNGTHRFTQPSPDIFEIWLRNCYDGAAIRVHPTMGNRLFHTTCPAGGLNFLVSDDRGTTGTLVTTGIDRTEGGNWVTPVEVASATTMYTATSNRVYRSTNADDPDPTNITWAPLGTADLTSSGSITTIASTPADPATVWAGSSRGRVYLTRDGANWTELWNASGGAARYIGKVLASETDADVAWVTLGGLGGGVYSGGHIFETTDGGSNWTDISGDLPDVPVQSLVRDNESTEAFWAGTFFGVYKTEDHGVTWVFQSEVPKVAVAELVLDPASNTIYAATHGRGMWKLTGASASTPPKPVPSGVVDPGIPMYATKAGAGTIQVTWDAPGCPGSTDYHLFYGDITSAATYTYTGAACNLGASGTATFPTPAGSVFWLMAGQNDAGAESGHRRLDAGPAWVPATSAGMCASVVSQDTSQGCP